MRNFKRSIADFSGFLAEYRAEKSFFRGLLGVAFRRNSADENVAAVNLCSDTDNTVFVKVRKQVFSDARNVARDFFGTEFRFFRVYLIFFYMNGSVFILFYKVFVQKNRVLVVVTFPCHEADKHIFAERKFAVVGRRTVRKNLSRFNSLTLLDDDVLVDAGRLVRTEEFGCKVSVEDALIVSYENFTRICLFNNTAVFGKDTNARVRACSVFHTGSDDGCFRFDERNCLTLHVRTHEGTDSVVVFKERDKRCRNGNDHSRRNVDVVNVCSVSFHYLVSVTNRNSLVQFSSRGSFACATTYASSTSAVIYSTSSVTKHSISPSAFFLFSILR